MRSAGARIRYLALRLCVCRPHTAARGGTTCSNPCARCYQEAREALRDLAAMDREDAHP